MKKKRERKKSRKERKKRKKRKKRESDRWDVRFWGPQSPTIYKYATEYQILSDENR